MINIKIKKNISNKLYYTLLILSFIFILGFGVYAFGTSSPSTFGHSAEEIAGGVINGDLTVNQLYVTNTLKSVRLERFGNFCPNGFTGYYGFCISNSYSTTSTYGSLFLQTAIVNSLPSTPGAHVCRRDEIIAACYAGGTSWVTPPSGYTMLLGDSCGDDCQLYVNHPEWCNWNSGFNIDGTTNINQIANWAVRICY